MAKEKTLKGDEFLFSMKNVRRKKCIYKII